MSPSFVHFFHICCVPPLRVSSAISKLRWLEGIASMDYQRSADTVGIYARGSAVLKEKTSLAQVHHFCPYFQGLSAALDKHVRHGTLLEGGDDLIQRPLMKRSVMNLITFACDSKNGTFLLTTTLTFVYDGARQRGPPFYHYESIGRSCSEQCIDLHLHE